MEVFMGWFGFFLFMINGFGLATNLAYESEP